MNYLDNLGNETLNIEYKVFNLYNIGLKISYEDAEQLVNNNKWIFNNYIIKNIKTMIDIYLPKYTCAYLSRDPIIPNSTLYFGVDDVGNIKGIPFQGSINENEIKLYIKKTIKNNIKCDSNILENINFELIKINYQSNQTPLTVHPYYLEYLKIHKEYTEQKNKYYKQKKVWYELSSRYNQKLLELVNNEDTRTELIKFIEYKSPLNPAVKLLKTDIIFTECSTNEVNLFKNDTNSIYHWVTKWKDTMLTFIKSIRPQFNFKIPNHLYPINILMAIDPMISYWFKFNKNMQLYLIKFKFKNNQKLKLKYKNIYNNWTSCVRLLTPNGPCCQHID